MPALACCRISLPVLTVGAIPGGSSAANAQSEPTLNDAPATSEEPQDIIVTAQRYSQRLQNVPISISAIGADELSKRAVSDIKALSGSVPSLNISGPASVNGTNLVSIRGIAGQPLPIGASQATAIYFDGIYLARPDAAFSGWTTSNGLKCCAVRKGRFTDGMRLRALSISSPGRQAIRCGSARISVMATMIPSRRRDRYHCRSAAGLPPGFRAATPIATATSVTQ